ncbi:MAG: sulfotransferase family protein [Gammaproteobacteria bacterium]
MNSLVTKLQKEMFLIFKNLRFKLNKINNINQDRIFIAGMQRSGTNMLMDILEKSLETDVYHEHDSRAFDNYQMRDKKVIQHLIDNSGANKFVIKSLCELQDLTELLTHFQPAKVIWIVRNYKDVIASMLNSFSNMEKQVIRIVHGRSNEWIGRGMLESTRNELKDLVYVGMGDASASAIQWYIRNTLFFNQHFENDARVLLISYEDLVTQPEVQVRKMCSFVGIHYHSRMISDIHATSINRRSPPVINQKIQGLCEELQCKFSNYIN